MIRLAVVTTIAALGALARRCLGRPRVPAWSWRLEVCNDALRASLHVTRQWAPARMRALVRGAPLSPLARRLERTTVDLGGVPAERSVAPGSEPRRSLLYVHGGGYVGGSVGTHRDIVSAITLAAGTRTWSIDYRLAPEHPFPAAADDVLAAYRALLATGVRPEHLAVAGDSAGGGLCLVLLQRLRAAGEPLPAAGVLISPAADLELRGASWDRNLETDYLSRRLVRTWLDHYLQGADGRDPRASPIRGEMRGLPPLLIQAGTGECLYDDIQRLVEQLLAAQVDVTFRAWEAMPHVWHLLRPWVPEGERALEEAAEFIRART